MRQDRLSLCVAFAIFAIAQTSQAGSPASADQRPDWVNRGSGAVANPNEGYRALYAVGVAHPGGGADARTLRAQALENGKQEIVRQLQALAATVTKNGGDSSDLVAPRLQGIQPAMAADLARSLDTYVGGDGTHYALVGLTGGTLLAVTNITTTSFNPLFDKAALAQTPADTIVGETSKSSENANQDMSKIREWGPEPVWIQGPTCPSLPASAYMCGRGTGSSAEEAVGAGATVLVNLLRGHAHTAAADFQTAAAALGLGRFSVPDSDDATNDAINLIRPQIQGRLTWTDEKGKGHWYAATCIERMGAAFYLADQFKKQDTDIAAAITAAKGAAADSDAKKDNVNKALKLIDQRLLGLAMLRTFSQTNLGAASPYALSDVADAVDPKPGTPTLAVDANGPYFLGFANPVVAGLVDQGVVPSLGVVTPKSDLKLTAKITFSGPDSGRETTGSTALELTDTRNGKELYKGSVTAKGTSTTNIYDAERAAIKDMAKQTVGIVKKAFAGGAPEPTPSS